MLAACGGDTGWTCDENAGGEGNFSPRTPLNLFCPLAPAFQDLRQVPKKGGGSGEVLLPPPAFPGSRPVPHSTLSAARISAAPAGSASAASRPPASIA